MNDTSQSLGRFSALVAALVVVVAAYSVHASLPTNALTLPFNRSVDVRSVLPQGWGYFSGDARQPLSTAYVRDGDGWQQVGGGHQGSVGDLFGLDRSGRLAEQEIGFAEAGATGEPRQCRLSDEDCLKGLEVAGSGENPIANPTLCGDVAIVRRDALPWAWSSSSSRQAMSATAIRVELSC